MTCQIIVITAIQFRTRYEGAVETLLEGAVWSVVFGLPTYLFDPLSDVHKMEIEQDVERQRDRARTTKVFDSKFNFNEPPPKVRSYTI